MFNRLITLIDMDCFYCQVEARLNPALQGKPIAVVQYQTWKGGGIIAVNYEARNLGVTRRMRGVDAKKHCPEIELVAVPDVRGKADLTKYRDAGREVIAVLNEFSPCVEKASIDEAYLDLTEVVEKRSEKVKPSDLQNTFVVGYPDEDGVKQWLDDLYNGGINDRNLLKLAQAAVLVEEIRAAVYERTGFRCSAGISHNKILAKLTCGLHKPNKQTVLPHSSISILYETLPIQKIRSLGGKFGDSVKEQLNCTTMSEVGKFSLKELIQKFGEKSGTWLYNIARGIDTESVKSRIISKSIGCCKNFPAHTALTTKKDVKHWIEELADEIYDRIQNDLIANKRRATLLTASTQYEENGKTVVFSRSAALRNYTMEEIVNSSLILLSKSNTAPQKSEAWIPPLNFVGMSVGKFVDVKTAGGSLLSFFKPLKPKNNENESVKCDSSKETEDEPVERDKPKEKEESMSTVPMELKEEEKIEPVQSDKPENNVQSPVLFSSDELPHPDASEAESCYASTKNDSQPMTDESNNDRPWSPIPHADEEPEFAAGLVKILDKLCKPSSSRNLYDNPIPSTSKDTVDPPLPKDVDLGFDYSKSFFCKMFKDETIYVPVRLDEPYVKDSGSSSDRLNFESDDSQPLPEPCTTPPMDVDETSASTSTNEMVERCAECHKLIPLVEFLEHLDHHAALKLQRELNRAEAAASRAEMAIRAETTTLPGPSKGPEKRKSKKLKTGSSPKKNQPITAFFSVKPPS